MYHFIFFYVVVHSFSYFVCYVSAMTQTRVNRFESLAPIISTNVSKHEIEIKEKRIFYVKKKKARQRRGKQKITTEKKNERNMYNGNGATTSVHCHCYCYYY